LLPRLTFIDQSTHLHVQVSGLGIDEVATFDYWLQIIQKCGKGDYQIVMVEEDLPYRSGLYDIYKNFSVLADYLEGITIIFCDLQGRKDQRNHFIETTAENLGIECYVFDDLAAAKKKLTTLIAGG
jgi:hypothetical protein